jgi:hypothetical protein
MVIEMVGLLNRLALAVQQNEYKQNQALRDGQNKSSGALSSGSSSFGASINALIS